MFHPLSDFKPVAFGADGTILAQTNLQILQTSFKTPFVLLKDLGAD